MSISPITKYKLSTTNRVIAKFIHLQESEADLAAQRIGQELITNTLPKSLFARSFVDLCDNAFREIFENIIVYLGPKFVGENILKRSKIKEGNNTAKAAIAVVALAIPLAEYSLSYVKNLFTLKMFKQADFNNIANLNKEKIETDEHQNQVKKSAKNHIKFAGKIFLGCLAFGTLLATKGKNSKALNSISEFILAPGSKLFKNSQKKAEFFDKYFGLDFRNKNGKLAISNGQITACVTAGFFGYTGAAKDRGKQDYKEVLYRFPLVGFYAISGNELFQKGFTSFMKKTNRCKELFQTETQLKKMPNLNDLEKFAKNEIEFKKLFKQKTLMVGAPVLFGFSVMGLFVAGCSRYFTKYRYDKDKVNEKQ